MERVMLKALCQEFDFHVEYRTPVAMDNHILSKFASDHSSHLILNRGFVNNI